MPLESEDTKLLVAALTKAQATMGTAVINKINPHYRSKYADLPAVYEAIRKALAANELCLTHQTEIERGVMTTKLRHTSGQWVGTEFPMPSLKPQDMGSYKTYAKRYSTSELLAVSADEDDDGNAVKDAAPTNAPAKAENKPLGEQQIARIEDLLEKSGVNKERLLAAYEVSAVQDLSSEQFKSAVARLTQTIKINGTKTNGNGAE